MCLDVSARYRVVNGRRDSDFPASILGDALANVHPTALGVRTSDGHWHEREELVKFRRTTATLDGVIARPLQQLMVSESAIGMLKWGWWCSRGPPSNMKYFAFNFAFQIISGLREFKRYRDRREQRVSGAQWGLLSSFVPKNGEAQRFHSIG